MDETVKQGNLAGPTDDDDDDDEMMMMMKMMTKMIILNILNEANPLEKMAKKPQKWPKNGLKWLRICGR